MDAGLNAPAGPLEYTGERMVPEAAGADTLWEHVHRYRFAAGFARGADVLDVACGEGYGAAALARTGAKSVVGVDVDPDTCAHARRKYGIDARPGDASALPFPAAAFDLVVSFETIEHVPDPGAFLAECARVLRPGGRLVISTPNPAAYNTGPAHNPFHCSEMPEAEFRAAVAQRFPAYRLYAQRPTRAAWWAPRSLRLLPTPWCKVNGFWRLQFRCRALNPAALAEARADPVAEILRPDEGPLARAVNPFRVTPYSGAGAPQYLICVARAGGGG